MSNRLYTTIPAPKVPRNTFDLSSPNSLTLPFQRVIPTRLMEILPGDLVSMGSETFARLQPMVAPVMNNMKISNHAFFVPLRTLSAHYDEFMFNNRNGDYSEVLPYVSLGFLFTSLQYLYNESTTFTFDQCVDVVRLLDYIGLPFRYFDVSSSSSDFMELFFADSWNSGLANSSLRVNLAPFFAYTKIWNEYFRDENVIDEIDFDKVRTWTGNVQELISDDYEWFFSNFMRLRPRAWQHDRFTSSLPFAQRGPDTLIPISGTAPVVSTLAGTTTQTGPVVASPISGTDRRVSEMVETGSVYMDLDRQVDFSEAALTTTMNDWRRALRVQMWNENSARGGVRPNEAILAHFGVRTPDATLDRAEFLGGYMQPIVVSEVAQTSETTEQSPQGTLAGKGTTYKGNVLFKHFFSEHGFVFVFTSALCRANYWQGLPKVFSRMQRDEYYWPEFANLGEEPVYTKELFAKAAEDTVFGYVPRYSDYKSSVGELHGNMRSTLDFWTQPREFANEPQLNEEFIFGNPSLSPFAVQSEDSDPIICTIQFNVKASRLMPFYGVPTI